MERWQRVDTGSPAEARAMLGAACGATRWIDRMMARRPFGTLDALLTAARDEWWALDADDWTEAFSHHPKIGDVDGLRARFPLTHDVSAQEQAGVAGADERVLKQLAAANREYADRFGFIFIVCATGKRADEMLELLRTRLGNDPATEIRVAAEEQAKITALRLKG